MSSEWHQGSFYLLQLLPGILVTSDLPVTIHVASVETNRSYRANMPDSYLARPISGISGSTEYFVAGYHNMTNRTAPM